MSIDLAATGRWLKTDFAEWFVGSWAKIIAWFIVGVIFFNFLIMDGYFSKGLGEGSGVDPTLFQNIGWMFRFFAATFLVLAVKFTASGMTGESSKMKVLGAICSAIVILHAVGFGLKALEGKRAQAVAVEQVAEVATQSHAELLERLERQKETIRSDLERAVAPLQARAKALDSDGKLNEDRTDALQARVERLEDAAQVKIDAIDAEELRLTVESAGTKAGVAEDLATVEKWAPLFVGIAQLFTWSKEPSDWAIYVSGVMFLTAWILLGDAIVIFVPPALYKLHLRDARRKTAQEAGSKGGKTTAQRQRQKLIAYAAAASQQRTATPADADTEDQDEPGESGAANDSERDEDGNRDRPPQAAE